MLQLLSTDSSHPDFVTLVQSLDADLRIRDGEDHAFYAQYNKIDLIKHVIVAYLDEKPVGCGAIKEYDPHTMEVKRMYVYPELRGQGIAGAVLQGLEKWAANLGYKKCVLETGLMQPEAIRLYQKSGYVVIPNYGQYVGIENSICFEKVL